jgi:uncharacterized protein (DUF849 family)
MLRGMARRDHPVILEVALNGATRSQQNNNVPVLTSELVADALVCLRAGAQIVHQHDDLGRPGRLGGASPERMAAQSQAMYEAVLAEIPDAILYPTANWDGGVEQRWGHQCLLAEKGLLRMAYLDPGSVNLGACGADGLPAGRFVYDNSFQDLRWMFERCAELRLGPNMAIYEPGFLRAVLAYERAGRLPRGAFPKLYFSERLLFGFPPTRPSLSAYLALLEGSSLPWAVAVLGGDVLGSELARLALEAGGHLRVGLEDYAGPGTPSNLELVQAAAALCAEVGRPLASRAEAARILDLPRT